MGSRADRQSPGPGKQSPGVMDLLTMGLTSALTIGAFLILGLLADGWAHTAPALTFVGLLVGVALAVVAVVVQVRKHL